MAEAVGLPDPPPMPDVAEPESPPAVEDADFDLAELPPELLKLARRKGYLDLADIKRFLPG